VPLLTFFRDVVFLSSQLWLLPRQLFARLEPEPSARGLRLQFSRVSPPTLSAGP